MQENLCLPSEEPQEQHQGEGAQEILRRNLLSQFLSYLLSDPREIRWASPILIYLQVL